MMKFTQAVLFLTLAGTLSVANATAPTNVSVAPTVAPTNCTALAADKLGASKTAQIQEVKADLGTQDGVQAPASGGSAAKRENGGEG